ncbi:hypothetical protein M3J09_008320 [Ascochyta lentis]
MLISALAFAGLAAASSSTLVARKDGRPDYSGSYWDVTISSQSGRPGYSLRDLTTTFHRTGTEHTVAGSCHYSFVPQGTRPPAETDRCDPGLSYTWDYTTLHVRQDIVVGNETLLFFGNAEIETVHRSDGAGGSSTRGAGRIELHHYCNSVGCSDPDGCVTIECQEGKTD